MTLEKKKRKPQAKDCSEMLSTNDCMCALAIRSWTLVVITIHLSAFCSLEITTTLSSVELLSAVQACGIGTSYLRLQRPVYRWDNDARTCEDVVSEISEDQRR